jgi:hypothetical protein
VGKTALLDYLVEQALGCRVAWFQCRFDNQAAYSCSARQLQQRPLLPLVGRWRASYAAKRACGSARRNTLSTPMSGSLTAWCG